MPSEGLQVHKEGWPSPFKASKTKLSIFLLYCVTGTIPLMLRKTCSSWPLPRRLRRYPVWSYVPTYTLMQCWALMAVQIVPALPVIKIHTQTSQCSNYIQTSTNSWAWWHTCATQHLGGRKIVVSRGQPRFQSKALSQTHKQNLEQHTLERQTITPPLHAHCCFAYMHFHVKVADLGVTDRWELPRGCWELYWVLRKSGALSCWALSPALQHPFLKAVFCYVDQTHLDCCPPAQLRKGFCLSQCQGVKSGGC